MIGPDAAKLFRIGWTRHMLKPHDRLDAVVHPDKAGSPNGIADAILTQRRAHHGDRTLRHHTGDLARCVRDAIRKPRGRPDGGLLRQRIPVVRHLAMLDAKNILAEQALYGHDIIVSGNFLHQRR